MNKKCFREEKLQKADFKVETRLICLGFVYFGSVEFVLLMYIFLLYFKVNF